MGHDIDGHGYCQDEDVVLAWLNFDAIGISYSEPLLRDFCHLVTANLDVVLVKDTSFWRIW